MSEALLKLASVLGGSVPAAVQAPSTSSGSAEAWHSVEVAARELANSLRSRGEIDNHEIVGSTNLPSTLTSLLKASRASGDNRSARTPRSNSTSAAYELLRVGANLCLDHDANRGRLLAAEYPQAVLEILESYQLRLSEAQQFPGGSGYDVVSILSLDDLKIIKTAFGALLNASMDYKPVRSKLISSQAPAIILRLTSVIYPAGLWRKASSGTPELLSGMWTWRAGLAAWSWRALEVLKDHEDEIQWDPAALLGLINSLDAFIPPHHTPTPAFAANDATLRNTLINADVEALQQVSVQIESLTNDEEQVRALLVKPVESSLAHTAGDPYTPLVHLLGFVERGAPPSYWNNEPESERNVWEKTFGFCKGAIIKGIVAVADEDPQTGVLWGPSEADGGWFVKRMVNWVKDYPVSVNPRMDDERDDLVICATLCLANLGRRESRCVALASPPISIVPHLIRLLDPATDIKLKHGVVGLLKNLAQATPNKVTLGEAGVVEAIVRSKIWDRPGDIADVVQLSAVGIVKHLATGSARNALKLFKLERDAPSGIDQILDLIRRTDSLALRNEGTRVLVNVIKTLWVPISTSSPVKTNSVFPSAEVIERRHALDKLTTEETADALGEMIGRNIRYPVLLNEGIMALTLLASQGFGVPHVLTALVSPLGPDGPHDPTSALSSANSSSQGDVGAASISTALDMVVHILSPRGRVFPPELRSNACSLLSTIGRRDPDVLLDDEKAALLSEVREAARPALVALTNEPIQSLDVPASPTSPAVASPSSRGPNLVRNAAARTLYVWGP